MPSLPLASLLATARDGTPAAASGLRGCSLSLLIAAAAPGLPGPCLVVTHTDAEARKIEGELRTLLPEGTAVRHFPAWDVAPYKGYSPSAEVTRTRIAVLHALATADAPLFVVAPATALLKKVVPPDVLQASTPLLRVGEELDRDRLLRELVHRGWLATDLCADPGTFARRGGILDLYPPDAANPVRVELWGDEIESIRAFDPWTQRSIKPLEQVHLLPVREEVLDEAALVALPAALKAIADERGLPPKERIRVQKELEEARVLQELELFLPCLQPRLATVFDYLGDGLIVLAAAEQIESDLIGEGDRLHARFSQNKGHDRLLPDPSALFLDDRGFAATLAHHRVFTHHDLHPDDSAAVRADVPDHRELRPEIASSKGAMLKPFTDRLQRWWADGKRVAVVTSSRVQASQLAELLSLPTQSLDRPLRASELLGFDSAIVPYVLTIAPGTLSRGALLDQLVIVAGEEIFGPRKKPEKQRRPKGHEAIGSTAQLARGDLVVHALHGVGRFEGLTKLQLQAGGAERALEARERAQDPSYVPGTGGRLGQGRGSHNDFLLLRYRNDDKLYLPVHKLNLLAKYVSPGGGSPKLDKLGGQTWAKRRKKVAEDVQKVARELLELYAKRQIATAHAYASPDSFYDEFASAFPYTETPDQQTAIDEVLKDMTAEQPMDRLVCGDVGFGKTEVAMRGAFLAVEQSKQVAVLVPTTVLALQHFEAFKERMSAFPVEVRMLSRFRSAAQQKETLRRLKEGTVDIVVGTHRLLSKDVGFKDLGLLVVDEEHRFGVKHKERIKEIRAGVDVLTLTATPIPRTLHMALAGLRDFSVIATPPQGRQDVKTSVARFSTSRIADAIRAELDRGGQIYFVHNRVQTIWRVADLLQKMVPGLRVRVGHGQMNERQLEDIMLGFFQGDFDLLLCTTIIESGLDVPRANTIIINRADRLGLAQMHQLRGRVGRAHAKGFCLLLVPPGRTLRGVAIERLKVIQDNSSLGAGHRIAQHDLEIRGAGSLLGKKQSGHMASVGMATYMELLEDAIRGLKGEQVANRFEPEVELRADAFIPGDYIPDERDRLQEYKRLADARSLEELHGLFEELGDRYGHPPEPVKKFEALIELKVLCRDMRVRELRMVRGGRLQLTFDPGTPLDPARLMAWVKTDSRSLSFRQDGVLRVSLPPEQRRLPVIAAREVLEKLRGCLSG
jgi:transcription-repair coupling factor (superfamily II helicase)